MPCWLLPQASSWLYAYRLYVCLEGWEDSVSRLRAPVTHIAILPIVITKPLTKSSGPSQVSRCMECLGTLREMENQKEKKLGKDMETGIAFSGSIGLIIPSPNYYTTYRRIQGNRNKKLLHHEGFKNKSTTVGGVATRGGSFTLKGRMGKWISSEPGLMFLDAFDYGLIRHHLVKECPGCGRHIAHLKCCAYYT